MSFLWLLLAVFVQDVYSQAVFDPVEEYCPKEGLKDFNVDKFVAARYWYLAYVFPRDPKNTFWLRNKCINVTMLDFPGDRITFDLTGYNDKNEKVKDVEHIYTDGSTFYGWINGLKEKIVFQGVDYNSWAFGRCCFLKPKPDKGRKSSETVEYAGHFWWAVTTSPEGKLSGEEKSALSQSLAQAGFSDFFLEDYSTNLQDCEYDSKN